MKFENISVIGLGYIGLPTAAMFAAQKIKVVGVDINSNAVELINQGKTHIFEPNLDKLVSEAFHTGYLKATTMPEPADVFLIAVPTPFLPDDKSPDLSHIKAATSAIAPVLKPGDLIILESTSPVGTTETMANWLADARPDLTFPQHAGLSSDIRIAYAPERVLPGNLIRELMTNDRIIGGMTSACANAAADLYKMFVTGECILASSPKVAEMAKLTENSFRDVNIAFANELSLICDKLDLSVWELIELANHHPRVNILQPGPGVGGHCIAVDPWFIVSSAPLESKLIRTSREINDCKPLWVVNKIMSEVNRFLIEGKNLENDGPRVALYGITFKPNIDDLRESPSIEILKQISAMLSCKTMIVEPYIKSLPSSLSQYGDLVSFEQAMEKANVHVLLVDHDEFKLQPAPGKFLVDTKGVWMRE